MKCSDGSFLCLAQPSTEIDYISPSAPDMYTNEITTITCKASGYADLRNFRLLYKVDGVNAPFRSGCGRNPEDDTDWEGSSTPGITTAAGIEGPMLSNAYCRAVARAEGFTFSVTLKMTDPTIRGKFYCRGFEGRGVGEVVSQEILVELKGIYWFSFNYMAIAENKFDMQTSKLQAKIFNYIINFTMYVSVAPKINMSLVAPSNY